MSLPAEARHRWGLHEGGPIAYLDLGDVLILIPGRIEDVRAGLLASVMEDDWEQARGGFGDPELATE